MKIAASHLLARYQSQNNSTRDITANRAPGEASSRPPAATTTSTTRLSSSVATASAVDSQERSFIAELLAATGGASLPASVTELAKGAHIDISA